MLKLFDYFRSSASYRVRIALNLKGLAYETVPIHLINNGGEQNSSYYQSINPQGLVPALADNDYIITQSLAIIEYLEDTHPQPALLPTNPIDKAYVKSIALMITADIHPLNNLRVLNYLTQQLHITETQKTTWYKHWVDKGLAAIEKKLQVSGLMGNFCYGDTPTLADICLIPQLYNAHRFSCDLSSYPSIRQIEQNCQKLTAFANALPCEATS